ncbi:poly(hydroxyalkanoate) granule-associated protein [Salinibacter ruber]|uniref:phasin family protein n=1 Tax=Salinibacter ruber TaxID=146919 RepID=UPI0021693827|nr:phasin family protein [Salinibacter ruber]MCS3649837.1 poly(hydroxyalkanoate) granule-associated protein [Salinibacter ruber]MCS3653091.1 poly(hydroxyalkanoate) granule-associated protein [Salinibacter ruber]
MTATNDETPTDDRKGFSLKTLPDEVSGRAREIWLAGLGALERLEQEGDKVFETLVERGRNYEDARRDQIEKATETVREQQETLTEDVTQRLDDATQSVEQAVSDTLSGTLGQLGLASRSEVRNLSRRVGELSKKLDALSEMLNAQQTAVEPRVFHVTPSDDGWSITVEGEEAAVGTHDTKKEAVSTARATAKEQAPSQLVVHKQDRSVQESFSYEADDK